MTSARKDASGADGKVPAACGRPAGTDSYHVTTRERRARVGQQDRGPPRTYARGHGLG